MAINAVDHSGKWHVPRSLERFDAKIGAGSRIEIQVSQWLKYPFLAASGISPRAQGIAARLENRIQNIYNTTDQLSLMPDGFNLAVKRALNYYDRLTGIGMVFAGAAMAMDNMIANWDGRPSRLLFDGLFFGLPTLAALGLVHLRKGAKIEGMLSHEALRASNERLGGVVHDLRNYLSPIIMASEVGKSAAIAANIKKRLSAILELVEGASAQDDVRNGIEEMLAMLDKKNPDELFATISNSAKDMLDMVTDLLNLSKPIILSDISLSIKPCIENALKIFRSYRKVSDKKIKLEVRYYDIDLELRLDEAKLKQALLNLLSNAADALGQGGSIIVSLRRKTVEKPFPGAFGTVSQGEYITIEVEDDGPGIPPEMLHQIFEFGKSTKQNKRGSGIGLAIVEKAMRGHNGNVTVETRYNLEQRGTKFAIFLPV